MTTGERDALRVVSRHVAAGLRLPAGGRVDPDASFADAGLDSAAIAVLAGDLGREFGVAVAAEDLYDYPTPRALAGWASRQMGGPGHG